MSAWWKDRGTKAVDSAITWGTPLVLVAVAVTAWAFWREHSDEVIAVLCLLATVALAFWLGYRVGLKRRTVAPSAPVPGAPITAANDEAKLAAIRGFANSVEVLCGTLRRRLHEARAAVLDDKCDPGDRGRIVECARQVFDDVRNYVSGELRRGLRPDRTLHQACPSHADLFPDDQFRNRDAAPASEWNERLMMTQRIEDYLRHVQAEMKGATGLDHLSPNFNGEYPRHLSHRPPPRRR